MDTQLTSKKRMTFVHDPNQDNPDAGTEIDRMANELVANSGGRLTYSKAMEYAMRKRPDLARDWLNGEEK